MDVARERGTDEQTHWKRGDAAGFQVLLGSVAVRLELGYGDWSQHFEVAV